ncbi:MAG: insulinase family protein, partial [Alistipes sp.]|nr:insulinase family protein [Alistipes sp.]
RERNGFTYGVFSAMVNFQQTGYLAIATQVGSEVTERALEEIAAEIEILRTELIPEEELELVKNIMAGEMMRILDGPFGIADVQLLVGDELRAQYLNLCRNLLQSTLGDLGADLCGDGEVARLLEIDHSREYSVGEAVALS